MHHKLKNDLSLLRTNIEKVNSEESLPRLFTRKMRT